MRLIIVVDEVGAAPERLDRLASYLRDELLQVPDLEITRLWEPPVGNSKGADAATVGTIAATLLGSVVVQELVKVLNSWISRGRDRTVKIRRGDHEIELSSATPSQQEELVARWISSADAQGENREEGNDKSEPS